MDFQSVRPPTPLTQSIPKHREQKSSSLFPRGDIVTADGLKIHPTNRHRAISTRSTSTRKVGWISNPSALRRPSRNRSQNTASKNHRVFFHEATSLPRTD